MKLIKKYFTIIVIAVICIILYFYLSGIYNGSVAKEEAINSQWSQVENQFQRRLDLIPNLVSTVKGYASHESGTLTSVIEARSKASQITVRGEDLTEEKLREFNNSQGNLSQALGKLMMLTENYPDLKANTNFMDLQAQLEGTENRISQERKRFNELAQEYNVYIRVFPRNMITSIFGFEKKPYFEADANAQKAPTVTF